MHEMLDPVRLKKWYLYIYVKLTTYIYYLVWDIPELSIPYTSEIIEEK